MKKTFEMIRVRSGSLTRVEGFRVSSPRGFEFFALFVHRHLNSFHEQNKNGAWDVTDLHTGYGVADGYSTKQEAVDHIDSWLKQVGRRRAKKDFESQIEKFGDILTQVQTVITNTIKSDCEFKNLTEFKKWAVSQLDILIDNAESVIVCYKCDNGETCFEHGFVKLCWRSGSYIIRNNKEPLIKIRDRVRAMRTATVKKETRSTVGWSSKRELNEAIENGRVTFTKERTVERSVKIETDSVERQQLKNNIAEGELMLKSGRNGSGKKMSSGALDAVERSVNDSRAKLGKKPFRSTKK